MKILILGNYMSPHILKWSKAIAAKENEICIVSNQSIEQDLYSEFSNIQVRSLNVLGNSMLHNTKTGRFYKFAYLKGPLRLKKIIKEFKPDILHSHYASGYGLIGALSWFKPFIISVWGADVFLFPKISFIHRLIFKFNMFRAQKILSTSHIMAKEIKKYTTKPIEVTPFGIDLNVFKPKIVKRIFNQDDIVIGTIKNLAPKYGIDILIKAFKIVVDKFPSLPLKLLIVGGGEMEGKLKLLTKELNIEQQTIFTGIIDYEAITDYHNMIDIYAALSIDDSESFGVAIIEASACEKPVVVSNVGGLKEVVVENETGLIVKPNNPEEAALSFQKLIEEDNLSVQMGKNGRKRVKDLYDFRENLDQMLEIYKNILN